MPITRPLDLTACEPTAWELVHQACHAGISTLQEVRGLQKVVFGVTLEGANILEVTVHHRDHPEPVHTVPFENLRREQQLDVRDCYELFS